MQSCTKQTGMDKSSALPRYMRCMYRTFTLWEKKKNSINILKKIKKIKLTHNIFPNESKTLSIAGQKKKEKKERKTSQSEWGRDGLLRFSGGKFVAENWEHTFVHPLCYPRIQKPHTHTFASYRLNGFFSQPFLAHISLVANFLRQAKVVRDGGGRDGKSGKRVHINLFDKYIQIFRTVNIF